MAHRWLVESLVYEDQGRVLYLGPIVITYSQYGRVLGKVFAPDGDFPNDVAAGTWRQRHEQIEVGMQRSVVDTMLGHPQAYDLLLHENNRPQNGPGVPCEEVYYGSSSMTTEVPPIALPPYCMFVDVRTGIELGSLDRKYMLPVVTEWHGPEGDKEINGQTLRDYEGWDSRYKHIRLGMTLSEVEEILGPRVEFETSSVMSYVPKGTIYTLPEPPRLYGPPHRGAYYSSALYMNKISVKFGPENTVISAGYRRDFYGYEAENPDPELNGKPAPNQSRNP